MTIRFQRFAAVTIFCLISICSIAGDKYKEEKKSHNGYTYTTVTNDPLKARIYTLKNGLKVYLTVYKNEPRIQTYIAVKAGSKNDPASAQGLAHYLEHILFKGTSKMGTQNWTEEKIQLEKIEKLYEVYRATKDTAARSRIYHAIDSVSNKAASYAIANEYDKALSSIGASGTNAYTWVEQTVYVNEIPSNNLEKWAIIESNRFKEVVPRLFHTELEAVYEEKNRSLDNDNSKTWEELFAGLFRKHTYGTQTTIGTVEHLKNPSITEIKKYFDAYYVPNNIAICLSGDLNPEETISLIDRYFGSWKPKPVPVFNVPVEEPITKPLFKNITGPTAEKLTIAYRFSGAKSSESLTMELLSQVLSNSQAGLIDLNLNQSQKILGGSAYPLRMKDYSALFLSGSPRDGQSLDDVRKLLISQIDSLKQGKFDDYLIKAIVNDRKKDEMKSFEKNSNRADAFVSAFVLGMSWKDYISELDRQALISKQQVIDFANKYLNDNYLAVYKRTGTDTTVRKIIKPQITAVLVNRDSSSAFYKEMMKEPSGIIKPVFTDYKKEIQTLSLKNSTPVYYKQNTENGLFELYYLLDMGTDNNVKLSLAVEYLKFLGTKRLTAEQLKKEFFRLGCNYVVFVSNDKVYVALNGLQENFDKALSLFEELLSAPKPDDKALKDLIDGILKQRANNKLNKGIILQQALANYAKYGPTSPFTNILSASELKSIKAEELTSLINSLTSYQHRILYYGPASSVELTTSLDNIHKSLANLKPVPAKAPFKERPIDTTKIYWVNYDMVQAEMLFISKSLPYDKTFVPDVTLFNEYFGGSMSSIVFQEIRESKALAYSVKSRFALASEKEKPNYIISYIGTQADKLPEAMEAMENLLDVMPKSSASFDQAKESIMKSLETDRITKADVLMSFEAAKKLGIDYDIRKDIYEKLPGMNLDNVYDFHQKYISKKPQAIALIASRDKIDLKALSKYGKVQELTLEDIFGY